MWMPTMDLFIRTMTDKWQTQPLVREGAPIEQDCNFHLRRRRKKNLVMDPRRVLDTKTYWLTDRQSQYNLDLDFDIVKLFVAWNTQHATIF
jgi:hypothetical protein